MNKVRRALVAFFSLLVAWLAVSLILGFYFGISANMFASLLPVDYRAIAPTLHGLVTVVLSVALAVPINRSFTDRAGRSHPASKAIEER